MLELMFCSLLTAGGGGPAQCSNWADAATDEDITQFALAFSAVPEVVQEYTRALAQLARGKIEPSRR